VRQDLFFTLLGIGENDYQVIEVIYVIEVTSAIKVAVVVGSAWMKRML
jgi:hypothetical protein